jgi:hypothetical protein
LIKKGINFLEKTKVKKVKKRILTDALEDQQKSKDFSLKN